jgi:transcriptional regulator with XRE-family HTH domain
VTSAQIRAARGLLDWTVRDLAERAGVPRNTLSNIETGAYAGAPETLAAIPESWNGRALSSPMAMRRG